MDFLRWSELGFVDNSASSGEKGTYLKAQARLYVRFSPGPLWFAHTCTIYDMESGNKELNGSVCSFKGSQNAQC